MGYTTSLRFFASVVICTGLLLGLGASVLHAEMRTFTDKQGRSLKAELVSVDGDKVTIKREDGQTFTLSLATLSDDDRQFVKEWAKQQAALIPAGSFEIQLSRGKFDTKKKDEGGIIVSEEQWGYTVTLVNRTSKSFPGARVDYILFVKPDNEPGKDSAAAPLKQKPGSKRIDVIGGRDSVNFRTEAITIFKQQLKAGYIWTKTGDSSSMRDTLHGVWVRAYVGDQLVSEFCSPEGLAKTEKWSAR
ncbi:MAG: hypothetical protein WC661_15960 [Opitutaceae bacterium]|jgi:hypothetical protein